MFPNNEPFGNIDVEKNFSRMVSDLPWNRLQALIQSNSQVYKRCTLGGHRFTAKHRKRFEKILLQEAQKKDFEHQFCSSVFAYWYPVYEDLYNKLEEYFHSEEYEEYKKEHEISDDIYKLPLEKFEEFFDVQQIEQWRVLLCFSPLEFTQEQAERIMSEAEKSPDLVERVRQLETEAEQLRKDRETKKREAENLQQRYDAIAEDLQELRQAKRDYTADIRELENKFKSSQAENKTLREALEQKQQEIAEKEQKAAGVNAKETERLRAQLQSARDELSSWKSKYEKQAARNRELSEHVQELTKQRKRDAEQLRERDSTIRELNGFATLILNRIDWPQAGSQMKLSPVVKQQFNSLLKKLNYEKDRTLSLGDTLPGFWDKLQQVEKDLIDTVAQSETLETASQNPEAFWEELGDSFNDVVIGLEARSILLRILREIFYQTFEMEDLETPTIPTRITASGKPRSSSTQKGK